MIEQWLFDTPWWLLIALAALGAAIFVAGNRRQDKSVMYAGGAILLLGIGLFSLSSFVDTDLEKAETNTRGIAAAVHARDWGKFGSLLDPATTVPNAYRNRDEIVTHGRETAERIGVKNVRIVSLDAVQTDTVITVDIAVLSEQDLFPGNTPTNWRFTYEDLGGGFRLARIEPLPNRVITPEIIEKQLSKPR